MEYKNIINACCIAETKIFKNNINEQEGIIKILAKGIDLITQSFLDRYINRFGLQYSSSKA
ncbi:hypothetical protein RHHCN13_02050 [Rickettsia conorii subsp. heilongjiangensis]|uniref:Uncharacterized protein n=2 Tax=spotted fever group TaxID=114277 RepID=A0ABM6YFN7_RICJA|nr:hypothetical protein [Rickettsia argasii]AXU06325.1 hypothetical protein D0Z68_02210 [Rickettsia japonica]BBM91194.1 hypothetical protein RHCH81_02050 [Rickettsia conorii subsp. heilongjiangensis]QHE25000.1 hypothetical protein GRX81_04555 [Rickettsia japonica]BBM92403.1 hypothetical protein RHHCN13_02050 [Rickettsia conorii subsp. heilongjiangensis]BBM93612.1 hypothetical protein RHSENDAI29_02050 [Rickettsia conorii subsp. heilongjiangensis]